MFYCCIIIQQDNIDIILFIMINEDSKKFGENLRRIRINKNITQVEIANILGVDRSFVSNIENGKNNPTLSTITSLAKALNIPIDELFK